MTEKRRIGRSDLMVSPLAFGGNVFGWTVDEQQSFALLDHFVAKEFNFIDTADVYSRWASGVGGESETILGKWMKQRGNRKNLVIATKAGMDMGNGKQGLSKKYILNAVNDSLKRLQTDYIDLYQSHRDDESIPQEETLDAFAQLIKEGKIRFIGASNFSAQRLIQSFEVSQKFNLPRYECLQPHYNLAERGLFENELEKVCIENEIGVIPYYALASGFLSGKYRTAADCSKSIRGGGAAKYLTDKGLKLLEVLDQVAKEHSVSIASVSLAWLRQRNSVTAPIASATTIKQLNELADSVRINLSPAQINSIEENSRETLR